MKPVPALFEVIFFGALRRGMYASSGLPATNRDKCSPNDTTSPNWAAARK